MEAFKLAELIVADGDVITPNALNRTTLCLTVSCFNKLISCGGQLAVMDGEIRRATAKLENGVTHSHMSIGCIYVGVVAVLKHALINRNARRMTRHDYSCPLQQRSIE